MVYRQEKGNTERERCHRLMGGIILVSESKGRDQLLLAGVRRYPQYLRKSEEIKQKWWKRRVREVEDRKGQLDEKIRRDGGKEKI